MARRMLVLPLLAAILLGGARAGAECPAPEARLRFLETNLLAEADRASLWTWSWRAAYAALAVGQAVPAVLLEDRGMKIDLTVGAVSSALGLAVMIIGPPEVLGAEARLAARTQGGGCPALAETEQILESARANQAFSTGWLAHVANAIVNLAGGAILGFGYGRWDSAALNTFGGLAIGELNIWTQPTHLEAVSLRYQAGDLGAAAGPGSGSGFSIAFAFALE